MTNILIVNAGSSSLKYQLMDADTGSVAAKGICERIGIGESVLVYTAAGKDSVTINHDMPDHTTAIQLVLKTLLDKEIGVISDVSAISAVGHRVVHGGEKFSSSALINDDVIAAIEACIPLGPLHNPANLMGIRGCMAAMPGVPMVAVFDTAWGQTMPEEAYIYALPYEAYTEYGIRRYGFHGTSHRYVTGRAMEKLAEAGITNEKSRVIVCHLGNGSSISAAKGGKCVDTTMGLTPLEGLPMGTRCGDIDPAIVTFLMDKTGMSTAEMDAYMNKKSGMLGISGVSSDFRDLTAAAEAGNKRAALAMNTFAYKVKKDIGAYAAAMGGVDAIVFTAGIGENVAHIREKVMNGLEYLGVDADFEFNKSCPRGTACELTKPTSKTKVFVIPTDEELMIALDTVALTK